MATIGNLRPTRLTSSESYRDRSLFLTLTPTVASLDRSEFVVFTTEVIVKLFERFSEILEGVIKFPQSFEHDQFVVLFQKDETSLSRRIMQEHGSIDISFGDKKHTYIRSCNTLEKVESENPSLFKVLIQNVEHSILHRQPKGFKVQWCSNVVYIRTSTPEKPKQPQPDPTDPNLNPPPVDPAIGNLLKELNSQPFESLQQLLLGLQLEASKRELHPNPTPNANPNLTQDLPSNNQPNHQTHLVTQIQIIPMAILLQTLQMVVATLHNSMR